ncbi:agmatine deiminase family protein [Dethiosulfatarculus sandiegensis]|nr:agmatine deiminase family protein [Dethiosulfatarculus sandiegensis]
MFGKLKTISLAVLFLLICLPWTIHAEENGMWRFPGEFEPHKAVWMGWLSKEYVKGHKTDSALLEVVKALAPTVNVRICVPDDTQKNHVRKILAGTQLPMDKISFYLIPFTSLYWRDFGPIFTVNETGGKSIADFNFNLWGYHSDTHPHARMMEKIDRTVAESMGLPSRMTRLVSEGGARELNGKGTIILTEACEFQRNPNLSREDLESEMTRMLGVTNFIWLKQGTVDDDPMNQSSLPGPGGVGRSYRSGSANNHTDEYCRFIAPDTVLLAEVSKEEAAKGPVERENRRRMEENYAILKKSTDQDGNRLKIIRIPIPDPIYVKAQPTDEAYLVQQSSPNYRDGTVLPHGSPVLLVPALSYCNFLISNDVVVTQKYWKKGMPESIKKKDEAALAVLQKAFPNRKIVPVHSLPINLGGGGIHCSTQQQPE